MIELKDFYKDIETDQERVIYFEPEAIKVIELFKYEGVDNKTYYCLQINNEYTFDYETKEKRDEELQKIFNAKGMLNATGVIQ